MNTLFDRLEGLWQLVGSATTSREADFDDEDEVVPGAIEAWLSGSGAALAQQAPNDAGLTLRFRADGRFDEVATGDPRVTPPDRNGYAVGRVAPFGGQARRVADRAYLFPAEPPPLQTPFEPAAVDALLRYRDYDLQIADALELVDGRLVRTVSQVVDGLYLSRFVLVYGRRT